MSQLLSVRSALPPHYYSQSELADAVLALARARGAPLSPERVRKLFTAVSVEGRRLALPLARYAELSGFGERNREWLRVALGLGEQVVRSTLDSAGLAPSEIQLFVSSTVTGLSVPSVEARLMGALGFSADCRRMPLFGLGCVAGAAGLSRVHDYLDAKPTHAAQLLCVDLGSPKFQPDDATIANDIACGLFGDGAASVVMVGDDHPLAARAQSSITATRSALFPDTERVMGWDIGAHGFRIVLSADVPAVARERVPGDVDAFLADLGLRRADVRRWIAHPGGPKVLQALDGLDLSRDDLRCSRDCLARVGNMSSASVLMVLEATMRTNPGRGGDLGLMLAMGPGFCSELVLLRW